MRKNPRYLKYYHVIMISMVLNFQGLYAQNSKEIEQEQKKDSVIVNKKEVKNRNEMLNAESNSSPRQVNIGLPFLGDILIMENDVPVVYTFYPQIPITSWKYDSSIGKIGLLSFSEGALTFGKVGYCVNSYDRFAGNKFKGYFQAYTNSYGSQIYSGSVSGPIGKNGWGYVVDLHETFDNGSGTNLMYRQWSDRTEMYKVGISKKYKKGDINLLYKHVSSNITMTNYQPLTFNGNGEYSPIPGFDLGKDSYLLSDGKIPYSDAQTGESKIMDLSDPKTNTALTDAIYLTGSHKFKNGFNLTYSNMFMHSKAVLVMQFPLSLGVMDPDQQTAGKTVFKYQGTSNVYAGSAQMVANMSVAPTTINTNIARIELTKKLNNHSLRLGITEQFYDNLGQQTNQSVYYQTREANPKLLDYYLYNGNYKVSNSYGLLPSKGGDYQKLRTNKIALYFSDDADLATWLNVGIGGRIERQDDKETHDQYSNDFINGRDLMTQSFNNKWNHVGIANFVLKLTRNFGLLGDITYNDFYQRYYDYPASQKDALGNPPATGGQTSEALSSRVAVNNMGIGVYYNLGNYISLVSKVTNITKSNVLTNMTIYNPANTAEKTRVYPLFYDISTIGWTTDIIATPFKNFNIHYLLTLQNPQYKNYNVTAFGTNYSYDNKIVPGLSKILMEIDPSYTIGDFKIWCSLRYFGKQYGNLSNSFDYAPWWENFAGVDYNMSRNVNLKLQVVNFLDQKGIKGTLQGADQITNSDPFIGRTVLAGAIRPRTVELTATFKL